MNRMEIVRQEILDQLYGYIGQPRTAEQIHKLARLQGSLPDITVEEINRQAQSLMTLGYVEVDGEDNPTPGIKRYVLTKLGMTYLEQKGMV